VDRHCDFSLREIEVNLLLDTHILLWWLSDDPRLGKTARHWIAEEAQSVFVSTASLWEISLKAAKGKLRADLRQIDQEIEKGDYTYLPVEPAHVLQLSELPPHHADPFDRLLVAQAIAENLRLLTGDAALECYGDAVLPAGNIIKVVPLPKDPVAAFRGRGAGTFSTDRLLRERRSERAREDEKDKAD
jgi:PIN domain nuclease of toxin-antitoxin system